MFSKIGYTDRDGTIGDVKHEERRASVVDSEKAVEAYEIKAL